MAKIFFIFLFFTAAFAGDAPFLWEMTGEGGNVRVELTVPNGRYLDAESVDFGEGWRICTAPHPVSHQDGSQRYPAGKWVWQLRHDDNNAPLAVSSQGCRVAGKGTPALCLLPETVQLRAAKPGGNAAFSLPESIVRAEIVATFSGAMNKEDFRAWLDRGGLPERGQRTGISLMWLLLVFLGGAALNFTPCVLPMIPVNLAIIGARGGAEGTRRAFCYASGMASAYGIFGAAVVVSGARFGDFGSMPWFQLASGTVFFLLALAAAGVWHLDLSRFAAIRPEKLRTGAAATAFLLGALAALLAGSCVAPVTAAVILKSAELFSAGDVWAAGLPFVLGAGMGAPWIIAGSGLAALPRPGRAMLGVKYVFAALLFAGALYQSFCGVALLREKVSATDEIRKVENALARAKTRQCPVVIDCWATWCGNCRAFEKNVLTDPEVGKALEKVEFVRFQAQDPRDDTVKAFLDHFRITGLPAFVMILPR